MHRVIAVGMMGDAMLIFVVCCAWREFYIFTVTSSPGRSKCTVKFDMRQISTLQWRGKYAGGSPQSDSCAVCDSSLSERLTPILVGYGINTLFYVRRQRSMDLPFPERKHSVFSG